MTFPEFEDHKVLYAEDLRRIGACMHAADRENSLGQPAGFHSILGQGWNEIAVHNGELRITRLALRNEYGEMFLQDRIDARPPEQAGTPELWLRLPVLNTSLKKEWRNVGAPGDQGAVRVAVCDGAKWEIVAPASTLSSVRADGSDEARRLADLTGAAEAAHATLDDFLGFAVECAVKLNAARQSGMDGTATVLPPIRIDALLAAGERLLTHLRNTEGSILRLVATWQDFERRVRGLGLRTYAAQHADAAWTDHTALGELALEHRLDRLSANAPGHEHIRRIADDLRSSHPTFGGLTESVAFLRDSVPQRYGPGGVARTHLGYLNVVSGPFAVDEVGGLPFPVPGSMRVWRFECGGDPLPRQISLKVPRRLYDGLYVYWGEEAMNLDQSESDLAAQNDTVTYHFVSQGATQRVFYVVAPDSTEAGDFSLQPD